MVRSKLVPIRFNASEKKELDELIDHLGIKGTFGAVPKTVKFAIAVTNHYLNQFDKVILPLEMPDLDLMFSSLKLARKRQEKEKIITEAQKMV